MKFILTKELGRLAKWLRILGYDSSFYQENNLSTLVITALREERVILTRNTRMTKFPGPRIVKISSDFVAQQLKQLLGELKLRPQTQKMFTRCVICNIELKEVAKERIKTQVPAYVYQTQQDFMICPECQRVYWQGTHWGNVRKYLNNVYR